MCLDLLSSRGLVSILIGRFSETKPRLKSKPEHMSDLLLSLFPTKKAPRSLNILDKKIFFYKNMSKVRMELAPTPDEGTTLTPTPKPNFQNWVYDKIIS